MHDLADMSPERVSVLIEKGDPAETIMTVARERNCDLLVTGVARNEILGRFTMGRTVDRLIGKWDRNLLVVTEKAMAPYSRVVVLTDLSETSKRAVEAAVSLFPDRMIDILYAYSAARSSSVENSESYVWQVRDLATRELSDFLASLGISRKQRSMINMVVEHGTEAVFWRNTFSFLKPIWLLWDRVSAVFFRGCYAGDEPSVSFPIFPATPS
jgi:nucleotide-binding universal stress UspA family protein